MLRNKDGKMLSETQINKLLDDTDALFKTEDLTKYGLEKNDYEGIAKFIVLLHPTSKELDNNPIQKLYQKIINMNYYLIKNKDSSTPVFTKILNKIVQNTYIKILLGKKEKTSYTAYKILWHFFHHNILPSIPKSQPYPIAFVNKYKDTVKTKMFNIRQYVYGFKNRKRSVLYKHKYSEPDYQHLNIDFDTLFKYLALSPRFSSNDADFQLLDDLTTIFYRLQPINSKYIIRNKKEKTKSLNSSTQDIQEFINEQIDLLMEEENEAVRSITSTSYLSASQK